ncbi:HWE histidine kinase domain-containing protein [Loktanella sp. M215]|uniref:HWE histidine kinase domain-containing protein n=1 Tax=Loktanella sp. M215 TaxID=2675431 RepID=UPI001F230FE8|nr:HWE histidine kinase domain-containing protein [Loktanella sp. M215]MCF7698811.1 PAS domain-containing protein [Loktanella sp. M215]
MPETTMEWDALFRQLPAPCLVLDRDMNIVAASSQYLASVNRQLDDIKGKYAFDIFPEDDDRLAMFKDAIQRALDGEANALVAVPYAIPVLDSDGQPTGQTREIWWTCQHNPVVSSDGKIRYVVQNAQDVTQQVMAEQLKDTVASELHHRVRNIFSLISATVKRTAAHSEDLADFEAKFEGRLMALSRTHAYLTGDNWDGITIDQIVGRELAEYHDLGSEQVSVSGTPIVMNATEAQILTLAVHELTTNSVKYGALKSPTGRLDIVWTVADTGGYDFEWREHGIRIDQQPDRKGFGSFILDSVVPAQLKAKARRDFQPEAFTYQLSVSERTTSR